MSDQMIAALAGAIFMGTGIILVIGSLILARHRKKRIDRCTAKTEGKVIGHQFRGDGRMNPVLEFNVSGHTYRAKKEYRGIRKLQHSRPSRTEAIEVPNGILYVKMGPLGNLKEAAECLWPIGSRMAIFYNPHNPHINYVDRPIRNSLSLQICSMTGVLFVVFGGLLYVCLR